MNPSALLSLLSDLYLQVTALQQENAALKSAIQGQPLRTESAPSGIPQDWDTADIGVGVPDNYR